MLYRLFPGQIIPPAARISVGLMAFAAGDALGTPWEGHPPREIDASAVTTIPRREDWPRGSTSDDTAQMLLVARHLVATGGHPREQEFLDPGDDEPGVRLRAGLDAAGVDTKFVSVRGGHTSEVVIFVEPSGERTMIGLWPDLVRTVPVPVSEVTSGDVVYFAAWHEGLFSSGGRLRAVVVTRAADGVVVYDGDGAVEYPAREVAAVDTTGAGMLSRQASWLR